MLLKGEEKSIKQGRVSPCCSNGACHTDQMKDECEELQNPPSEYISNLVENEDQQLREQFLNNTMPLNNTFAFASVGSEKATDAEMVGGRLDTCKYNGIFSHF